MTDTIGMTTTEAAEFLRLSKSRLYDLVHAREIPFRKLGRNGHLRFDPDALRAWAQGDG